MNAALGEFEDLRRVGAARSTWRTARPGLEWLLRAGARALGHRGGALLVREAGGVVTDWTGDETAVFRSGDILAGGPLWHQRMLQLVRQVEGR